MNFTQLRLRVFSKDGQAVLESVPNKGSLLGYDAAGASMCQDLGACSKDEEDEMARYWSVYSKRHDGISPLEGGREGGAEAKDSSSMQQVSESVRGGVRGGKHI